MKLGKNKFMLLRSPMQNIELKLYDDVVNISSVKFLFSVNRIINVRQIRKTDNHGFR